MSSEQHVWVLSGGLASGKSEVRKILEDHGFHTIDADRIGHEVLQSDGGAFDEVSRRWPGVIREGEVDRAALAEIVFNDSRELAALEAITHPHIFDTIKGLVKELEASVVAEVPVLKHLLGPEWRRIVVDARDEVRLERAVGRGMAKGDALARLAAQPSRAEWLAAADVVVPNHSSTRDLVSTVAALLPVL